MTTHRGALRGTRCRSRLARRSAPTPPPGTRTSARWPARRCAIGSMKARSYARLGRSGRTVEGLWTNNAQFIARASQGRRLHIKWSPSMGNPRYASFDLARNRCCDTGG